MWNWNIFFNKNEKIQNADEKIYGDIYRVSLLKQFEKKESNIKKLNKIKNTCVIFFLKNIQNFIKK